MWTVWLLRSDIKWMLEVCIGTELNTLEQMVRYQRKGSLLTTKNSIKLSRLLDYLDYRRPEAFFKLRVEESFKHVISKAGLVRYFIQS